MAITVRDIIAELKKDCDPIENTVDVLAAGQEQTTVNSIATTFIATYEIIERAKRLGVQLLITHEGLYYSHRDALHLLENDPVYKKKQQLIAESELAIFRYHDYSHRHEPDYITAGLVRKLGWDNQRAITLPHATIVEIPTTSLPALLQYIKQKLQLPFIRYSGSPDTECTKIGLLVGYRGGGDLSIPLMRNNDLNVLICGEGPEWETAEYVRDCCDQGNHKALITLGHSHSEEPGMEYIAQLLQQRFPQLTVQFLPVEHYFQFV